MSSEHPMAVRSRRRRAHLKGDHSQCVGCEAIKSGEVPPPADLSPMVRAYESRLRKADKLGTPEGELVMFLARKLADAGLANMATVSRELRAAMEVAMEGVEIRKRDVLDELDERRQDKVASA